MRTGTWILFLGLTTITVACSATAENIVTAVPIDTTLQSAIYENEYGKIHLIELNDSMMRTVFSDNEKIVFDTTMYINNEYTLLAQDEFPLLQLRYSGIKMYSNRLVVHDFAGPAHMAMYTGIPAIYDRPFYKTSERVIVSDAISFRKGGSLLDLIYVNDTNHYQNEFVHVTGTIKKEKYPREFYSTPDEPQGMFGDTNVVHYRLVMHDFKIEKVEKETYTGTAKTLDHRRAFISDFADSEAYYLDDEHPWETWPDNLEGEKIQIKAVLIQFEDGRSVLKAWEILD